MLHLFRRASRSQPSDRYIEGLSQWSIRKKLLVFLLPAVIAILAATGMILNVFSNNYIELALERSSLILTLARPTRWTTCCRAAGRTSSPWPIGR